MNNSSMKIFANNFLMEKSIAMTSLDFLDEKTICNTLNILDKNINENEGLFSSNIIIISERPVNDDDKDNKFH